MRQRNKLNNSAEFGPQEEVIPSVLNSILTSVCLGLLVGFAGTMYHASIWYSASGFYLPWGVCLALLLVFLATTWASLRAGAKTWAGTLVGGVAFLLIVVFGFAKSGSLLVLANPVVPVGVAGTVWMLGTLAVTVLSNLAVARYRSKVHK